MYSILLSAGWPIWPLLIISIIGLAIVIERTWYLRQIHIFPKDSLESVFGLANALSQQKTVSEEEITSIKQLFPVGGLFACLLGEKASANSADSALEDSFNTRLTGLLDSPHYTRPENYQGQSVPPALLSGHHINIARWRREQSLALTAARRPDLIQAARQAGVLSKADEAFLKQHADQQTV